MYVKMVGYCIVYVKVVLAYAKLDFHVRARLCRRALDINGVK